MRGRISIVFFRGLMVLFSVSVPFASVQAQERRSFPDTREGIHVFYDQIPWNATDPQLAFAARHFTGCQKIPLRMVTALRRENPSFLVLGYRLAFGTYDTIPGYIVGDNLVNDWDSVRHHTDWFITSGNSTNPGGRVRQTDWNWYVMDISGEVNGNRDNGWKEYWVRTVAQQLRATACDGVFADSFGIPWNLDFPPDWLLPGADTSWIRHMRIFGRFVSESLHGEAERFLIIPNLGPWITTRDVCDYGEFIDGAMVEMFGSPGAFDLYEIDDWKLQMNRLLDLEHRGKIVICQAVTVDEWAVDDRLYSLANYLLVKGSKTYYNLAFGENFYDRLVFFPECTAPIGHYLEEPPHDIDDLLQPGSDVYVREYSNGWAVLNPTWEPRTFTPARPSYIIDRDHLRTDPRIDVPEDGNWRDSVRWVAVNSVELPPKGGAVLLKSLTTARENVPDKSGSSLRLRHYPEPSGGLVFFTLEGCGNGNTCSPELRVYDALGRTIEILHLIPAGDGEMRTLWNGCDADGHLAPQGVYTVVAVNTGKEGNLAVERVTIIR
ncbi:MAG: putative glycoside hydrolase [Bacteroidota bacterium]|nr:putative glycoside hydrolase [Bacteroidota bacterium]